MMKSFDYIVESFDLLYSTSNTLFSSMISLSSKISNGCGGNYTHIALCLKGDLFPLGTKFKNHTIDPNKMYLFESVIKTELEGKNIFGDYFNGVQLRDFDDVLYNLTQLKKNNIVKKIGIAKLNMETKLFINEYFYLETNKQKFYNYINKLIGKQYNNNWIDLLYVPFHNFQIVKMLKTIKNNICGKTKGILCSELIGMIYLHIGLLDECVNLLHILPEDFLQKTEYETFDIDNEIPVFYEPIIEIH